MCRLYGTVCHLLCMTADYLLVRSAGNRKRAGVGRLSAVYVCVLQCVCVCVCVCVSNVSKKAQLSLTKPRDACEVCTVYV